MLVYHFAVLLNLLYHYCLILDSKISICNQLSRLTTTQMENIAVDLASTFNGDSEHPIRYIWYPFALLKI